MGAWWFSFYSKFPERTIVRRHLQCINPHGWVHSLERAPDKTPGPGLTFQLSLKGVHGATDRHIVQADAIMESLHGGRSALLRQEEWPTAETPQLNTPKGPRFNRASGERGGKDAEEEALSFALRRGKG